MSRPELTSTVVVRHLPEQSDAESNQHAFAYTFTIRNTGDITAQLIARHWIITDSEGHTQEVRGLAVVGHQPLLKPGETFEYTSFVRLGTSGRHDARHLLLLHRRGRGLRGHGARVRADTGLGAALIGRARW